MNLKDWIPAKDAARQVGISYELFMSRCYKGKIKYTKIGWAVLIHKDEVARAVREQLERSNTKG